MTDAERSAGQPPETQAEQLDIPDWLWPLLIRSLGDKARPAAIALQSRAPVHLRVNLGKSDVKSAISMLADDGIASHPHPASGTALEVTEGNRRIRQSTPYQSGLVELQDAASQAVVDALPLRDGMRVLDYCAGGGGKALAMAAQAKLDLFVYDVAPERMHDLPERATRAGVQMTTLSDDELATAGSFDLVLCDAPCSGSGSWRRAPDAKWRLTADRLQELGLIQSSILNNAAKLTAPDGVLVYVTCSMLLEENEDIVNRFLTQTSGWTIVYQSSWLPQGGTDGFFTTHLTRE